MVYVFVTTLHNSGEMTLCAGRRNLFTVLVYTFIEQDPQMAINNIEIVNLHLRIHDNQQENETFVIKISKQKKVDSLRPIIKKRLAPLFDHVPSTQICLI